MRVIYGAFVECSDPVMVEIDVKVGKKYVCRGEKHHVHEGSFGCFHIDKCPECNAIVDDVTPTRKEKATTWVQMTDDDKKKLVDLHRIHVETFKGIASEYISGIGKHDIFFEKKGESCHVFDHDLKENVVLGIKDEASFKASFMKSCGPAIDELKKYYKAVVLRAGLAVQCDHDWDW
jgi:hypothetical protein